MGILETFANVSVPETLKRSLTDLLLQRLELAGAVHVEIHPELDYSDTPIVSVTVKHRLVKRPLRIKEIVEADTKARDLAWEAGERRFVHVDHIYHEKQEVAELR